MNIQTVYIEITNRCNLNCRTCYNRSGLNCQTTEISVEQLEQIITTLSRYGANRFLLSGGEPSLHREFHKILKLTEKFPAFSFGFVTNGTNPDPVWLHYLNTHANLTLQISLDGVNEAQNSLTRGAGSFEKTVDFARKIHNPELKPLLKMVLSQSNLDGAEEFYRFAVSLGCIPEFAFIYKSGNGADDWDHKKLSPQQKLKILKLINKLNKEYDVEAYLPRCTSSCPLVHSADKMSVCVKTDGSLQPCQSLYAPEFTLGNLFAWNEKNVLQRVEAIMSLAKQRTTMDYGCQKCLLNPVCGRGCMAEAFHLCKDPLGDDGDCLYRKLQFLNFEIGKQREA